MSNKLRPDMIGKVVEIKTAGQPVATIVGTLQHYILQSGRYSIYFAGHSQRQEISTSNIEAVKVVLDA